MLTKEERKAIAERMSEEFDYTETVKLSILGIRYLTIMTVNVG